MIPTASLAPVLPASGVTASQRPRTSASPVPRVGWRVLPSHSTFARKCGAATTVLRVFTITCILATPVHAQRLNLISNEPAAGSGSIALRDAEIRRTSARESSQSNAPPAAFFTALDTLIAALLEQGEAAGVPGTRLVTAARKLEAAREPLKRAIEAKVFSDALLRPAAADLTVLTSGSLASHSIDAELRDALAPVIERLDPEHTFNPWPDDLGTPAAAWPEFKSTDPDLLASLKPLRERLEIARGWSAYRGGAASLSRLVGSAGGVFGRESTLAVGAYKRWTRELALAASEVLADATVDPLTADRGHARLRRLAAWSRVLDAIDRLTAHPLTVDARLKPITDAIGPALELMPETPPPAAEQLDRLAHWLERLLTREQLQDDKAIVRQLRPAFRAIADLCRTSQSESINAVAAAVRDHNAAGDPGVMAAVNMHARNVRLLFLIRRASDAMRDPAVADPVARDIAKPVADGLLRLARDVADPKLRDRAIDGFANLARDAAELMELPEEPRLRAREPALDAALGTHSAGLLGAIERERVQWRRKASGTSSGAPAGEQHAARLRALRAALSLASDLATLERDHAALSRFGPWTAHDSDLVAAVQAAKQDLHASLPAITEPNDASAAHQEAAALIERHALVRLAARIQSVVGQRPELRADSDRAHAAAFLLGAAGGGPDPRWALFALERDEIGVVCRYWREGAESSDALTFARSRADQIVQRLNALD